MGCISVSVFPSGTPGFFPTHGAHARSSGSAGMLRRSVAMGELFGRWLRGLDLNQRPSGYEPDELPDCSIPRHRVLASETPKGPPCSGQPFDL